MTHNCAEPRRAHSYNTQQRSPVRYCDLICGGQDQMHTMGIGKDGREGWVDVPTPVRALCGLTA